MKFTEEKLEKAFTELFSSQRCLPHHGFKIAEINAETPRNKMLPHHAKPAAPDTAET